jgi:hypothetical protein
MTCDDCAESENGKPAQSCCGQCLEEQSVDADEDIDYLEEHIVEVEPPGPRVALIRADKLTAVMEELDYVKANALDSARRDRMDLIGALALLKQRDARIAELEAALEGILIYAESYARIINVQPERIKSARNALAKEMK